MKFKNHNIIAGKYSLQFDKNIGTKNQGSETTTTIATTATSARVRDRGNRKSPSIHFVYCGKKI